MKLSSNAIEYTIRNLFEIAFPNKTFSINSNDDNIVATIENINIIFWIMSDEDSEQLLQGKLTMNFFKTKFRDNLPIYTNNSYSNIYDLSQDSLHIHCDLITLPFILWSRYEETLCNTKDKHSRFPYKNSLASLYQFIDYPIIDEYALLLRDWTQQHFPEIQILPRESEHIITHDIDILYRFGNSRQNLRTIFAGDLIARHNPILMFKSWKQFKRYKKNHFLDPYILATLRLLEETPQEWKQIFFFKAQKNGEEDCTYNIQDKEVKHLIKSILLSGKGVGLHGSYGSYDKLDVLKQEKQRLEDVCEKPISCQRQHYLRFDAIKSPQNWKNSGLQHDFTLGYAEREGFRCGTCHPYPLYDIVNDCVMSIIEHPLIAMDTTLIQHRRLNRKKAYQQLHSLLQSCKAVEGDFVLLWHNTATEREFTKWYKEVLTPLLQDNKKQ